MDIIEGDWYIRKNSDYFGMKGYVLEVNEHMNHVCFIKEPKNGNRGVNAYFTLEDFKRQFTRLTHNPNEHGRTNISGDC